MGTYYKSALSGVSEISIVDFDVVDAGTTSRWPLGLMAAGEFKTDAIENFIRYNYPYIVVNKFLYKVGATSNNPEFTIDKILEGVNLIYDATAETGVSHYLSQQAKDRLIPYITLYGTPGVWGGAVMKYIPSSDQGCWMCFQYSLRDGIIPTPPTNRDGSVQAAGCGDISFTGSSFELENIVSTGVRIAVGILCMGEGGYISPNADVGILSLIDENGKPILPKWTSHQLLKHTECNYCNTNV